MPRTASDWLCEHQADVSSACFTQELLLSYHLCV